MPEITFTILSADSPDRWERSGTWADLLEAVPYFLWPGGPVPPIDVVNEVLSSGGRDAGQAGGCVWTPTTLDESSYATLVADLLSRAGRGYRLLQPPSWVRSARDYMFWSAEVVVGIPGKKNKEYADRLEQLDDEIAWATHVGEWSRREVRITQRRALQEERDRFLAAHRSSLD